MLNSHQEAIICPNCQSIEQATVEHTHPWDTYIHHCSHCQYIIMESEWEPVQEQTTKICTTFKVTHPEHANDVITYFKNEGEHAIVDTTGATEVDRLRIYDRLAGMVCALDFIPLGMDEKSPGVYTISTLKQLTFHYPNP